MTPKLGRRRVPAQYADKVLAALAAADIPGLDPWDGLTRYVLSQAIARAYAARSHTEEIIIDEPRRANWRLHSTDGRVALRAHHLSDARRSEAREVEKRVNHALLRIR